MSSTLAEKVRQRLSHAFNPDVAAVAGLSVQQLQQVAFGGPLSDQQVKDLARYFGIKERVDG